MHIVNDEFLEYFQHTFLIRDPSEMLPSYYHKMPDLEFDECGYQELFQLFKVVIEKTGEIPVVLHADDLVEQASEIVRMYCSKIGIPFVPKALQWNPPGNSDQTGWFGDRSWNEDLRISTGFQNREKSHYVNIHDNQKLRALYDLCLPYYDELYQHRLQVTAPSPAQM